MAEPEAIRAAIDRTTPALKDVQRYVQRTLGPFCRHRKYIFLDRVKEPASLADKLEGGRVGRWSDIDDLYGATVVIPIVARHEDLVVKKLSSAFVQHSVRSRTTAKKAPDVFRFHGLRWYGSLSAEAIENRQPGVDKIRFEVQVITAFEYAWLSVTHDLVYKGGDVDWKKQRLAAQLKAAVEQIEVLIAGFEYASAAILESPWPESDAKSSITERCIRLAAEGLIPDTICPQSWRRFADNVYNLVKSYQRDPGKIGDEVYALLDSIEAELRTQGPDFLPYSGSLFQYVVSLVARGGAAGNLERFTVVPSREFQDFYNIASFPKQFVFDGIASDPARLPIDHGN